jgi:hypothetical protein
MSFNRETLATIHQACGCDEPVLATTSPPSAA